MIRNGPRAHFLFFGTMHRAPPGLTELVRGSVTALGYEHVGTLKKLGFQRAFSRFSMVMGESANCYLKRMSISSTSRGVPQLAKRFTGKLLRSSSP